jgi:hypothetical protein
MLTTTYLLHLVSLFRTRNRRALLQYTIETSEDLIRRRLEAGQKSGSAARRYVDAGCSALLCSDSFIRQCQEVYGGCETRCLRSHICNFVVIISFATD